MEQRRVKYIISVFQAPVILVPSVSHVCVCVCVMGSSMLCDSSPRIFRCLANFLECTASVDGFGPEPAAYDFNLSFITQNPICHRTGTVNVQPLDFMNSIYSIILKLNLVTMASIKAKLHPGTHQGRLTCWVNFHANCY